VRIYPRLHTAKEAARNKKLERRHFIYGAIIFGVVIIGALYLLNLSPYKKAPTSEGFYDPSKQMQQVEYLRAKVLSVSKGKVDRYQIFHQTVKIKILDGENGGQEYTIDRLPFVRDAASERLPVGSQILVTRDPHSGKYTYFDRYRVPGGIMLLLLMLALVAIIGRWRGFTGVIGLLINIGVLAVFVVPRIVAGHDAFITCMEGALVIVSVSIFVAHGFSRRTSIAFISSIATLIIITGLSLGAVYFTGLTGSSGEESQAIGSASNAISLSGMLTGGIIIASLGVLDDITTGQAAAVDELRKANPELPPRRLYKGGLSVGREHIAALVNTLALAYVGVALPLIVLTALYNQQPLLVVLNSETIMQEVVRTGVASIGLLLGVPFSTALAAYLLPKWYAKDSAGNPARST